MTVAASNSTTPTTAMIARARRQTLADLLARSAARCPNKLAIACGDTRWSFDQFDKLCDALATALVEQQSVAPGTRVAVLARNSHWFAALRFAVARAGAIFVPINFMLNHDEVAYILDHSGAELLFVDAEFAPLAEDACATGGCVRERIGMPDEQNRVVDSLLNIADWAQGEVTGDILDTIDLKGTDLAQIVYTSGTESRPKGALLTHDAVIAQYVTCIVEAGIAGDDTLLHALPLYHCAQLDVFLGPAVYLGATSVITAAPTPANIIALIKAWEVSSFFAPPTVWIAILADAAASPDNLSTLQKGYYGASIMPVEVLKSIQRRFPALELWNLYGQTEIAPVATILKPEDQLRKAGSAGKPGLNIETRVVDDAGVPVGVGEIGEVVHRSPQLLSGYYNDPDKTAEAFEHGWFHSGDLATVDDEGYITIVDRKKDMIKTGGENVSSREVEEAIYPLAGVEEVSVIGIPDAKWIEAVTAIIVRSPDGGGLDEAQVIAHCNGVLAHFKVPKRVVFVDALPKNPSGKVLKRDLREQFSS